MKPTHTYRLIAGLLLLLAFSSVVQAAEPDFVYETNLTGYYLPSGRDMIVDDEGNAYVIGAAYADQVHLDILIAKLDPNGTELWSRYIQGSGHDTANDIVLDDMNDVYITGWTDSPDFPVANALDPTLTGFRDAYLMKLSGEDGSIVFSTLLGGDYVEQGRGIALNDAGEIYVVGSTGSTDFPTVNAYQSEPSAPLYIYEDAFITRFAADGSEILYSTYFGGFEDDVAHRIALDSAGNIIIAGGTNSDDFPLLDAIQAAPNDLFVAKLSADGSTLEFSTYFGGEDLDGMRGMAIDAEDRVYLTGSTRSAAFPTTPGAFQEQFAGAINGCGQPPYEPIRNCEDAYLTKLATDGTGIIYSTYLGGDRPDEGDDVVVDGAGCAYVVGYTSSDDYPGANVTSSAIVVSKLSESGGDLIYTLTKVSGAANRGHGIALGPGDDVYFTGALFSPSAIYVARTSAGAVAGIEPAASPRVGLRLGPGTPNPFSHSTTVTYSVPEDGSAITRLAVYDASGRLVRTLVDAPRAAGPHRVSWDGTDEAGISAPSGVYFYELRWGNERQSGRTMLIR